MTALGAYEAHVAALSTIDDEDARLEAIVALGRRHREQPFSAGHRTDANLMHGCMSRVWIVHTVEQGRHVFRGDSDALIVNGLVAIMTESFSGLTDAELGALSLDHVRRFKLGSLTAQRQVGMMAMLRHFRRLAGESGNPVGRTPGSLRKPD